MWQCATPPTCKPVLFIGNKCDLEHDRVISKEQGKAVADELSGGRVGHHETSAKNNINVTPVRTYDSDIQAFEIYGWNLDITNPLSISL